MIAPIFEAAFYGCGVCRGRTEVMGGGKMGFDGGFVTGDTGVVVGDVCAFRGKPEAVGTDDEEGEGKEDAGVTGMAKQRAAHTMRNERNWRAVSGKGVFF